jgi:hypothetical protein
MKHARLFNYLLVPALLLVSMSAQAQTSTFTPNDGAVCSNSGISLTSCPVLILGKDAEGNPLWVEYNTTVGIFEVFQLKDIYTFQVVFEATDLKAEFTPILTYQTTPVYGNYQKFTFTEMKGTFTGGSVDFIFETVGNYIASGSCGRGGCKRGWYYTVTLVNEVVDQNGTKITGAGPSVAAF